MATTAEEKQIDDKIIKFYVKSLEVINSVFNSYSNKIKNKMKKRREKS